MSRITGGPRECKHCRGTGLEPVSPPETPGWYVAKFRNRDGEWEVVRVVAGMNTSHLLVLVVGDRKEFHLDEFIWRGEELHTEVGA